MEKKRQADNWDGAGLHGLKGASRLWDSLVDPVLHACPHRQLPCSFVALCWASSGPLASWASFDSPKGQGGSPDVKSETPLFYRYNHPVRRVEQRERGTNPGQGLLLGHSGTCPKVKQQPGRKHQPLAPRGTPWQGGHEGGRRGNILTRLRALQLLGKSRTLWSLHCVSEYSP